MQREQVMEWRGFAEVAIGGSSAMEGSRSWWIAELVELRRRGSGGSEVWVIMLRGWGLSLGSDFWVSRPVSLITSVGVVSVTTEEADAG